MALLEFPRSDTSRFKVKTLRADRLRVHHAYQRDIIPSRVKKLSRALDLDYLGVLIVSYRDGEYWIIDGQHRHAALLDQGLGDWEVTCKVYENLTPADEAALFRRLNDTKKITAWDDFRAGLEERDPECVAINSILELNGISPSNQKGDGKACCIAKLRQLYRAQPHGFLLDRTLQVSTAAYGVRAQAVEGDVLGGLGIVLNTYGEVIDEPALIQKLAKARGGAPGLVGRARTLREVRNASIDRLVAAVIVGDYNRGKRSGALPDL